MARIRPFFGCANDHRAFALWTKFSRALTGSGIHKGNVTTLAGYTQDAKQLAEKHGIEIVNEAQLADLLQSTNAISYPEVLQLLNDTAEQTVTFFSCSLSRLAEERSQL